ncbi:MAG TPA: FAD:protein FMN transferase, partial [Candidatus Margulisiibacteriota bacterium]|nr:FAD:protein FMN transferase [Candidatus Margulisiibacteriota bacterium]
GTFVEVISADRRAGEIVFKEIGRIEGLLSKYIPESEVSRLNKEGSLKVSPDTFYILKKSIEFYRLSNGAFDITVAPLVDLWGFSNQAYRIPEDSEIKAALSLIGADKIVLQDDDYVVKFKTPGMKIDLGAIAKGYALDCSVKKLREAGIESCLVNAGGQIYCLGSRFGRPWRVAVREPNGSGFSGILELKDQSSSTSGDYEQYFVKDGLRYSHIFDPKTGHPVSSRVRSVTVVAADGLTADALSTAIFVLGRQKGEELARRFSGVYIKINGGVN